MPAISKLTKWAQDGGAAFQKRTLVSCRIVGFQKLRMAVLALLFFRYTVEHDYYWCSGTDNLRSCDNLCLLAKRNELLLIPIFGVLNKKMHF